MAWSALSGCQLAPLNGSAQTGPPPLLPHEMPPAPPRELRAAWVASVAYIDWPARAGLNPQQQRADMTALLQRAQSLGLNALVVQIRPAADALYRSALEPWSEYLTGEQGRAPDPDWDPLSAWVEGAHERGIELHAWLNPYRARHSGARSALSAGHLARTRPDCVRRYGDQLWLDPSEPAALEHTAAVVADVVRRYDIDAIHIDDYFYPYPITLPGAGAELPFPDDAPWLRYLGAGGPLGRDDWRRDNVNRLVQRLYTLVHQIKPQVRLGISPFGLPRPDLRPAGIQGFSQYHKLYADVELWLREGWLDYLAPQLYWPLDRAAQAFEPLLDAWLALNPRGRHIWPGLFTSSIASAKPPWPASEVLEQIERVRRRPAAGGHLHFSMAALLQDRDGIATRLQRETYALPALAPATPWLQGSAPGAPTLAAESDDRLRLRPAYGTPPFVWALWQRHAGRWQFSVQPAAQQAIALAADALGDWPDAVVASAIDRTGQEGARTALKLGAA